MWQFLYTDDLLLHLEKAGIGCHWNHHYVGAACYADDIVLHAPSPSALRYMSQTCSDFAESHNLSFNAAKTQLMKFSMCPSTSIAEFVFCGQILTCCESMSHLGHILSSDLSDDADIVSVKKDMSQRELFASYFCSLQSFNISASK